MSQTIKFILNDQVREVSSLSPTMTLLQYLRTEANLKGTKEGCAEGDCGACTTVVGRLEPSGEMKVEAINACIAFLPTLDGRQIITVEHLAKADALHPVQKAMVECHASQCGFCTPGFVMSLSALAHNKQKASDENIQDAIAGNLCRCTGYRPILDAARQACGAKNRTLNFSAEKIKDLKRGKIFHYEADGQTFLAPLTLAEVTEALSQYPQATLLCGGTDVGLWVTKKHRRLETIIYLGNVRELHQIDSSADGLKIGAAVSYSAAYDALAAYDESLEDMLRRFASVQIRNSGTVGGNIANGSPIGDGPPPLIALGAKLILRSAAGQRTLNLEDYFIAYGKQDRRPGEFVEKVIVPAKKSNTLFKVYKVSKRFDQDISAVCGAFALTMTGDKIEEARIAFGGMAGTPKRATKTEEFLTGKVWTHDVAQQAMAILAEDYTPFKDMRASAEYRRDVAQNLLYRFYLETTAPGIETRVYGYGS